MRKLLALSLLVSLLSSCASGPPADPNNICRVLADERGWKKDARKAYKRWGLPPHIGFAFIHRESTFDAKAKPERKKLLGVVPLARPSSAFGYAQAIDETWSDYKKAPADDSPNETIWAMRLILLVGITTSAIAVLDCPRATPIACISPITVATVAMLVVRGRGHLPLRATQKKRLDRPPYTNGSSENAVFDTGGLQSVAVGLASSAIVTNSPVITAPGLIASL